MGILSLFSNTRRVTCPDGRKVDVYRDENQAIRLYVSDYDANLFARADTGLLQDAGISAHLKRRVRTLMDNRDDAHAALMYQFRVIYGTFATDPCSNGEFLKEEVKLILETYRELQEQKNKIFAYLQNSREHRSQQNFLEQRIQALEDEILRPQVTEVAEAFETTRQASQKIGTRSNER